MLNENAVHLLPGVSFSEKPFGATYNAFLLNIVPLSGRTLNIAHRALREHYF